jgi:hypothetical protein
MASTNDMVAAAARPPCFAARDSAPEVSLLPAAQGFSLSELSPARLCSIRLGAVQAVSMSFCRESADAFGGKSGVRRVPTGRVRSNAQVNAAANARACLAHPSAR